MVCDYLYDLQLSRTSARTPSYRSLNSVDCCRIAAKPRPGEQFAAAGGASIRRKLNKLLLRFVRKYTSLLSSCGLMTTAWDGIKTHPNYRSYFPAAVLLHTLRVRPPHARILPWQSWTDCSALWMTVRSIAPLLTCTVNPNMWRSHSYTHRIDCSIFVDKGNACLLTYDDILLIKSFP